MRPIPCECGNVDPTMESFGFVLFYIICRAGASKSRGESVYFDYAMEIIKREVQADKKRLLRRGN